MTNQTSTGIIGRSLAGNAPFVVGAATTVDAAVVAAAVSANDADDGVTRSGSVSATDFFLAIPVVNTK
jgi:hypothetical protein